jgi:CRISPR system Cascade subunit CasC
MLIEMHILQNFAPANLNRDDTGSPKDCIFGGHRRARVSSQCWKRAVRLHMKERETDLHHDNLSERTKRLLDEVTRLLIEKDSTRDEESARRVAQAAIEGVGLSIGNDRKTQYLLFLGHREITQFAEICDQHWVALLGATTPEVPSSGKGKSKSAKERKKDAKDAVPPDVKKTLNSILNGGKAVDLALFGRMVADRGDISRDAASQVAHAISTNRVAAEFDYYTAVDDLQPKENAGAGMIGTVEFNSACFYRYANVDLKQLRQNLDGDDDLAKSALQAFMRAFVLAIPTGKQNSMAAQNLPSFVMAVARDSGPCSLANAFCKPVDGKKEDLVEESIERLIDHWSRLTEMYGDSAQKAVATLHTERLEKIDGSKAWLNLKLNELVQQATKWAFPSAE